MFDPTRHYRPSDPELEVIAKPGTLRIWRHRNQGPAYIKFGNRILYRGIDLNAWLEGQRVEPSAANAA